VAQVKSTLALNNVDNTSDANKPVSTAQQTALDLKQNTISILGAANGGTGVAKVYEALLSQSGTNAPTATVLTNTLGGTVVWTYDGVGIYLGTLTGAFTSAKTVVLITGDNRGQYLAKRNDNNSVIIVTGNSAGTDSNDLLNGAATILIKVYP
jgi:hypothetical protein